MQRLLKTLIRNWIFEQDFESFDMQPKAPVRETMENHLAGIRERAEMLHSPDAVQQAVRGMARQITAELQGRDPLLLCVMNGAIVPTAMLMLHLDFSLRLDYVHATRYRGETSGGELHWRQYPAQPLQDQDVLVVDDIFDEGTTLAMIVDHCRGQGARSVLSAVLVEKIRPRETRYRPDFIGLQVEDRYVFGAGMDYREYLRNLPGIYAVSESDL